ncbi:hypothetical protein K488DRAFT_57005, partial [Vararia minispora EC-137]
PEDVLDRTGPEIAQTSAAATQHASSALLQPALQPTPVMEAPDEGVIMRDRMFVRVSLTKDLSVGAGFDEETNRLAQYIEPWDWLEFMVVWRPGRIELYDDYNIPLKERVLGHKRLAYSIPLRAAKLTLYSFTDLSFCIACRAEISQNGVRTDIPWFRSISVSLFIFKAKNRSRATDWIMRLWRRLGGQLPSYVEVRSPVMDVSLKVDIPSTDEDTDAAIFSHDNLVKLCKRTLSSMPDWKYILETRLAEGAKLELAWRADTELDWVWWRDDIKGRPRDWAVLSGLALNQPGNPARLEIRIGEHFPSFLHLQDGSRLYEPQPIEGFLSRVKPRSRQSQEVYLTVHDGLLFTLIPSRANQPLPPGVAPLPSFGDNKTNYHETLRLDEVRRGARQVALARGVMDLRQVLVVRRAFQVVPAPYEPTDVPAPGNATESVGLSVVAERDEGDELDTGGEAGLQRRGGDRGYARMRRCFELVMKTGEVVRFEAYSAHYAIEWIERLRELVRYWRLRHLADAQQEMDTVHLATGKQPITPRRHVNEDDSLHPPDPLADPSAVLPYLSFMYHWCIFESCRPITKTGRLYVRQGGKRKYQLVHLFIVNGHLVQFHISGPSTFHKRRGETIQLVDTYVVSGVLAAQALPAGEYQPNAPTTARRYRDGLENNDREEDTLFIVIYYPHTFRADMDMNHAPVPTLGTTRSMLVCRARSRVERDLWCWALNTEIEKVARAHKDREEALRTTGGLYVWKDSEGKRRGGCQERREEDGNEDVCQE